MATASHSIHIDAASGTVFDRIVDPTDVPPGITIRTVDESPGGAGNIYGWIYRLAGIPIRGTTVYTEYVPNRRFACEYRGRVAATAVFSLEPEHGGTRLTREVDFKVHIPLLGRLLEALMVKAAEPAAVRTVVCPRLVDFFVRRGVEQLRMRDEG